jgi:hypothetical protein
MVKESCSFVVCLLVYSETLLNFIGYGLHSAGWGDMKVLSQHFPGRTEACYKDLNQGSQSPG